MSAPYSDVPDNVASDNKPRFTADPRTTRDAISGPNLLEMDDADAAKRILSDWNETYKYVKGLQEQWRANRARAKGYTGVSIIKQQNDAKVYIPKNAKKDAAIMNIAARLKRRLRAYIFADPPVPEATPATDEDDDRDNAETATRVLQYLGDEGQLGYALASANAFDVASDYASGFIRFWVDQFGGQRPKSLMASPVPQATAQNPLIDPQTSAPWMQGQQIPDPVLRYVKQDGTLTDDKADEGVVMEWLPTIRREILSSRNIRFLPWNCEDLWDADGVMVGVEVPLGQLKRQFPQIAKMTEDQLAGLTGNQPIDAKILAPRGQQKLLGGSGMGDDQMVFVCSRYHRQSATYPKGAYLVAAGKDTLLYKGELWDAQHGEPLDIPLTQFLQYHEEENPYGIGVMEYLGPGNELLAFLMGVVFDHLDKYTNRKTFVPMHSNVTAEQMQSPSYTLVPIIPGGEPHYEELPDLPPFIERLLAEVKADLDDESGLQETAQGVSPPGVKSGIHAQTIIEQVIQGLSELRQHVERGLVRGWRVVLQQVRAYYTVPQQIRWQGEDQSFKVQEFTGAELGDTRDVRIQRGSFTGLTPTAKANIASQLFQITDPKTGERIMSAEEYRHIIEGNVGGLIATLDNPSLLRVRRQIMKWREGPPDGWAPPQPQMVQGPQGPQQQAPPDQALAAIFSPEPVDADPQVARVRAYELQRAIQSVHFGRKPPEWQNGLRQAYEQARQAAGLMTVQDQQQAQQAQTQAAVAADAKPKISLGLSAPPLAMNQVGAILQQEGIQLPAPILPPQPVGPDGAPLPPGGGAPAAPAAPPQPMQVHIPAQAETAQALQALAEAHHQGQAMHAQALEQLAQSHQAGQVAHAQALESMSQAMQQLAARPTKFRVTKDGKGKATGIEPA